MTQIFSRLRRAFSTMGMSPRDRYLMQAADLADLELRQKSWDKMVYDRDRYYTHGGF